LVRCLAFGSRSFTHIPPHTHHYTRTCTVYTTPHTHTPTHTRTHSHYTTTTLPVADAVWFDTVCRYYAGYVCVHISLSSSDRPVWFPGTLCTTSDSFTSLLFMDTFGLRSYVGYGSHVYGLIRSLYGLQFCHWTSPFRSRAGSFGLVWFIHTFAVRYFHGLSFTVTHTYTTRLRFHTHVWFVCRLPFAVARFRPFIFVHFTRVLVCSSLRVFVASRHWFCVYTHLHYRTRTTFHFTARFFLNHVYTIYTVLPFVHVWLHVLVRFHLVLGLVHRLVRNSLVRTRTFAFVADDISRLHTTPLGSMPLGWTFCALRRSLFLLCGVVWIDARTPFSPFVRLVLHSFVWLFVRSLVGSRFTTWSLFGWLRLFRCRLVLAHGCLFTRLFSVYTHTHTTPLHMHCAALRTTNTTAAHLHAVTRLRSRRSVYFTPHAFSFVALMDIFTFGWLLLGSTFVVPFSACLSSRLFTRYVLSSLVR